MLEGSKIAQAKREHFIGGPAVLSPQPALNVLRDRTASVDRR
jgi:hypothetical protein